MLPFQKQQQNMPYAWQGSDTSTFQQQAQNLGQQVGNQGLNTDLIDVQKQTAQAKQKAAQTAQNVAAGASQVAQGAQVDPTVVQANEINNQTGIANPTIQPYRITQQAPAAPDTSINENTDFSSNQNFQDPTIKYLQNLFPNGIPDSIISALGGDLKSQGSYQMLPNPQYQQFAQQYPNAANVRSSNNPYQPTTPQFVSDSGVVNDFKNYLNQISQQGYSPQDVQQYQNALQNQYAQQLQNLEQQYNQAQGDISSQMGTKSKAVSDYIDNLNKGLQTYQQNTQDLGNIGNLSDAEQAAAAKNAILAAPKTGIDALSALSHGHMNQNLAALTQQAQNAAIQQAEGRAGVAQSADQAATQAQQQGQTAQNNAYKNAGDTINKTQQTDLKKLQDSQNAAVQALTDSYNNARSNLSNQEQQYVNNAQQTLQKANVSPSIIQSATGAFANTVQNYINNNKLSNEQKQNIGNNLEAIWRIAVGANPSDIHYSDQIAGTLAPLLQQLGFSNPGPD